MNFTALTVELSPEDLGDLVLRAARRDLGLGEDWVLTIDFSAAEGPGIVPKAKIVAHPRLFSTV